MFQKKKKEIIVIVKLMTSSEPKTVFTFVIQKNYLFISVTKYIVFFYVVFLSSNLLHHSSRGL